MLVLLAGVPPPERKRSIVPLKVGVALFATYSIRSARAPAWAIRVEGSAVPEATLRLLPERVGALAKCPSLVSKSSMTIGAAVAKVASDSEDTHATPIAAFRQLIRTIPAPAPFA